MIQIYNSCRHVKHNLKFLKINPRNRSIYIGRLHKFHNNTNDDDDRNVPEENKSKKAKTDVKKTCNSEEYPEEPTTCCMSGCANCVWLEYAEKLSEYYKDGGEQAIKEIKEKITDENVKAFLLHELKMRNLQH